MAFGVIFVFLQFVSITAWTEGNQADGVNLLQVHVGGQAEVEEESLAVQDAEHVEHSAKDTKSHMKKKRLASFAGKSHPHTHTHVAHHKSSNGTHNHTTTKKPKAAAPAPAHKPKAAVPGHKAKAAHKPKAVPNNKAKAAAAASDGPTEKPAEVEKPTEKPAEIEKPTEKPAEKKPDFTCEDGFYADGAKLTTPDDVMDWIDNQHGIHAENIEICMERCRKFEHDPLGLEGCNCFIFDSSMKRCILKTGCEQKAQTKDGLRSCKFAS